MMPTLEKLMSSGNFDDEIKVFAMLLSLSDDTFEHLEPVLLESIEQSFNSIENKLAFVQMLNIEGVRFEDFSDGSVDFMKLMSGNSFEKLSTKKKDFLNKIYAFFLSAMEDSEGVAKRVIQIPIELCNPDAKLPTYATIGSAAMDVYSTEEYIIKPGETHLFKLGIKCAIPKGYALLIQPRSGLSLRSKIRIANTPGLIDCDYHEEIGVIIENIDRRKDFTIDKGERIAQMRLVEVPMINWVEVNSIGTFDNNHGEGYGSTGNM